MTNRRIALFTALAISTYFGLAYYFKASHVEDVPSRDDIAIINRILPTATPGTFVARIWLPNHVKSATIYEAGTAIGPASAVYDDPDRTYSFAGRRWKYVEFNSKGEHVRRWIKWDGGR